MKKRLGGYGLGRLPYKLENGAGPVGTADQALYPMQSGSFVGRGPWLHATSPCRNQKAEKEATDKFLSSVQVPRIHAHTHHAAAWAFLEDHKRWLSWCPVSGEAGSAGNGWKVGGYKKWLRWLLSGKLLRKHGKLMTKGLKSATCRSAGIPLEAPDRNSQSPESAVQRTSRSARGIHVARPRRGGEWRRRNMMFLKALCGWRSWIRRQWLES